MLILEQLLVAEIAELAQRYIQDLHVYVCSHMLVSWERERERERDS